MDCLLSSGDATRVLLIGVGATAFMDLWLIFLKKRKVPSLSFAFIGRWIGHIFRGTWFHQGIAKSAPVKGELLMGWLAHYAIGILFAVLLIAASGIEWLKSPTLMPALLVGAATVLAPLLVIQPAMGAGIASSKTATPVRNCIKSVVNHSVFGLGLYLAALLVARSV